MINNIDAYLYQLKKELAGCDRATIQDALSDAEEYIRNAMDNAGVSQPGVPAESVFPTIVEQYGSPAEVAEAYKKIEARSSPSLFARPAQRQPSAAGRFFGVVMDLRSWGAILYFLFALATGIFYFTWTVTGISLSLGLLILVIGIPLAGLFILSTRGLALLEGRLVEALLGVRMPRRPLFSPRSQGLWAKFTALISDRYSWFSLAYFILMLPLGIIYFTVFVTLLAVSLFLVVSPILEFGFGVPIFVINDALYYVSAWMMPIVMIVGGLLFILTLHLAKFTGYLHGRLAKAMLVRD